MYLERNGSNTRRHHVDGALYCLLSVTSMSIDDCNFSETSYIFHFLILSCCVPLQNVNVQRLSPGLINRSGPMVSGAMRRDGRVKVNVRESPVTYRAFSYMQ